MDTAAESQEALVRAICERYKVGEHYVRAYLRQMFEEGKAVYPTLQEILCLPPPQSVWFEYWMNTNQRAEQSWHAIDPLLPVGARRYLDIGCGVGGSLLAAHRRGLEVHGIEIDPERIELGEANCCDAGLQGVIQPADILDEELVDQLGCFDVITLMSVIEHVLDVSLTLKHVTRLLNPGGILFMEIPNRECPSFVAADPHFSLFGITLLERTEAMAYQKIFFNTEYDVGDYFPLEFYIDQLEKAGCQTRLQLKSSTALGRLMLAPLLLARLERGYVRYRQRTHPRLDTNLASSICLRFECYLKGLFRNLLDRPWRLTDPQALVVRHLLSVWVVVAQKKRN